MDFTTATIQLLKFLADISGNWGVAIIILTVLIKLILWPSSVSQQRSMRTMQMLQPKMKAIQERYKSDPQTMQRKMMEFYKEHKFNPMAGCLPALIQLPVFILLYTALISPQFIELAGNTNFLFIKRLDATIKSNAGVSFDGVLGVDENTKLAVGKGIVIHLKDGETIENVKITNPADAVSISKNTKENEPAELRISVDSLDSKNIKFSQIKQIETADVDIINPQTRETEKVEFKYDGANMLVGSIKTTEIKNAIHYDVILLVILCALTMWLSQKVMMASQKNAPQDPTQAAIQKSMGTMMPIMMGVMFFVIPIPAGVLLYIVTSSIFQVIQTIIINKQLENEDATKAYDKSAKVTVKGAKTIEAKDVKDVEP